MHHFKLKKSKPKGKSKFNTLFGGGDDDDSGALSKVMSSLGDFDAPAAASIGNY